MATQSYARDNVASEPWTLEADRITYQDSPQRVTAEGGVMMRRQEKDSDTPLLLKANSVTYVVEKSRIDATGGVILQEKTGTITAGEVQLNLREKTGRLTDTNIILADQEIMFSGQTAEKIGDSRYVLRNGRFTACRTSGDESPDWSIKWNKADITIDGLAFLKHATFNVKKAPLLYIPYLILPAKTTRQTGFLFPELSHSSADGFGLIAPFFINLSPSSDLTYYPGYYEKRGFFNGLEFRRIFDHDSQISLSANYLRDRTEDQGPPGSDGDYRRDGYLRTEHNRYWLRGKADRYFEGGKALHLDIDTVSDQDYLHEFGGGISGSSKSKNEFLRNFRRGLQDDSIYFRESILQLVDHGENSGGGIEVRYVDNVLSDFTGIEAIHTLPRLRFDGRRPLEVLPLSFDWESEYLYYRPEEGIGYQRLDLKPKLIMATPFGDLVEGSAIAGFRETAYEIETIGDPAASWNSSETKNRNSFDFSTNIATILARDFRFSNERNFTHTFRPNLRYSFLEHSDQNDLPDLDNVDRLNDDNSFTVELNNYFRTTLIKEGNLTGRPIGYLKLRQSYDLDEARHTPSSPSDNRQPFSDLSLDLEISPLERIFLRYQTALNVYGNGISHYNVQGRYSNARDDSLIVDYNYLAGVTRDLSLSSRLRLTEGLLAGYRTTRSLLTDHTTDETFSLIYTSQCWEMELASIRDSEDRRVILAFSLTGIGKAIEVGKSGI